MRVRNLLPIVVLLSGVASMTACSDKPSQKDGIVTLTTPTVIVPIPQLTPGGLTASPSGAGIVSTTVFTFRYATQPTGGVPPYSYSWKFGDGAEGAGNPVVHM